MGMRGGSSKTRIETWPGYVMIPQVFSMRGGSSKTRIETMLMGNYEEGILWYERRFQ